MSSGGPNINQIARSFVSHYYKTFDTNRPALKNLYREKSMMTYEKDAMQGGEKIMKYLLEGVKYRKIMHKPSTMDVQPSGANGLLIVVTGDVKVDEEKNALKFTETFHLVPTDEKLTGFWIHNDVFKLIY